MNRYTLVAAAAIAAGGMTYTGCDRNDTASNTGTSSSSSGYDRTSTSTTGPTAGERVDNAADRTGDALSRAADKTKDAAENAAEKTKEVASAAAQKTKDAADTAGEKLSNAAQTAGAKIHGTADNVDKGTAAAPDAEGIRDVLASVTEAALTENGLDDLTERLVDADRNHIGSAIGQKSPEHTALVKQFRADWKAKYGQDFDIKNEEAVYPNGMFQITQGEISKAAPSGTEVATGQRAGDLDSNREAGRNVATVVIAESHGMPGLSVPLVHEMPDAWRIDAPNTLTAEKLRSNVIAHLQAAHSMKDQWPADVNQAYAAVTHHVLEAILDRPVQSK